jgi:hypothetical protein
MSIFRLPRRTPKAHPHRAPGHFTRFPLPTGLGGVDTHLYLPGAPFAGGMRRAGQRDAETVTMPAASPIHMTADEYGMFPCCGQHETQVPGRQADDPRQVTCRTAAHDTLPDDRAPMPRPYTPQPPAYVPDIHADIRDLPVLRDTIRVTTQHHGTECGTCGRTLPGRDWRERFAAQLAHLGSGEDKPSNGTVQAPEQADETAETEEAA